MRVLGIDPGTVAMGYGVVEKAGTKLTCVEYGVVKPKRGAPLHERLLTLSEALDEVIERLSPEAASIEEVFHAKNVKSAITLGHARGVALLSASKGGLSVFEYSPSTIKQAVTGYGMAEKGQVQKMVSMLLSTKETPLPDAADALAAAICHINHIRPLKSGALSRAAL